MAASRSLGALFSGRVEEGQQIIITVAGRAGARLVPAVPRAWRQWGDVAEQFAGPARPRLEG
jgi:antitoxin (DNA-binding transcriptional repressor) of toxin-antitoxin stability system